VGNHPQRSARRLGVSPTAAHFTESEDREIHREVVLWFRQAVGLPASSHRLRMETRSLLRLLAWLSAVVGALLTLRRVANKRRRVLRAAAATAFLGVALLSRSGGGPIPFWLPARELLNSDPSNSLSFWALDLRIEVCHRQQQ